VKKYFFESENNKKTVLSSFFGFFLYSLNLSPLFLPLTSFLTYLINKGVSTSPKSFDQSAKGDNNKKAKNKK
jgi:hypothetical protein